MKKQISLFLALTALSFNLLADAHSDFVAGETLYNQNRPSEALTTFIEAAKAGSVDAQNRVGTMYAKGIGTDTNYDHALIWFRAAAKNDHPEAIYNVGKMYQLGLGVAKSPTIAIQWYNHALALDSAEAANNLADMYLKGSSVEQNTQKAEVLFVQAAELGSAVAQRNLGFLYFNGKGIKQDINESYFWFDIAASNHYPDAAQYRDFIASKLPPKDLAKAQQRASDWLKQRDDKPKNNLPNNVTSS